MSVLERNNVGVGVLRSFHTVGLVSCLVADAGCACAAWSWPRVCLQQAQNCRQTALAAHALRLMQRAHTANTSRGHTCSNNKGENADVFPISLESAALVTT